MKGSRGDIDAAALHGGRSNLSIGSLYCIYAPSCLCRDLMVHSVDGEALDQLPKWTSPTTSPRLALLRRLLD